MRRAAILLGVLGFVGLWDLWVAVRPELTPVSSETMAEAQRVLSGRGPGTQLVHSPLLGVQELSGLGDLSARPDLPLPAVRARRRLWVLDRADQLMGGLGAESSREAVGESLILRTFEPSGEARGRLVVFDLVESLRPGVLRIERPRGQLVSTCTTPRAEGGFSCPGQPDWLYAAPRQLRIDGKDQRCVWAHPTTGGAVVFLLQGLPAPTPGHVLKVEVRSALTDEAVRLTGDGASISTRIVQQGRSLGRVVRTNSMGWSTGSYPIGPGPVRIEVTAPRDGRRHHCLDVQVVEVEQDAS